MLISKLELAIFITSIDHLDLATKLNNLGTILAYPYNWTGNINNLEMAISKVKLAISITSINHLNYKK